MSFKEKIRNEVAKGNLDKGIEILLAETKDKLPEVYTDAIGMSSRLSQLERDARRGIISFSNKQLERNKLTIALLSLLSDLEENDNMPTPPNNQNTPNQESPNKIQWDEFLRWLNRILAGYVYKTDDIRNLAKSFNLPVTTMQWDNSARTNWFNVLDYYVKRDKNGETKEEILKIIQEVINSYGSSSDLQKALEWAKPKAANIELKELEYKNKVGDDSNYEKLMKKGVNTLLPIWFLETGLERGKSVGRIETEEQYGTGFLLKGNYLLTNNHVISSKAEAENAWLEMNYEKTMAGGDKKKKKFTFDLSEDNFFATSIEDDWTIIKVKEDANTDWGYIEINEITGMKKDDRVVIIQHPEGEHKQIGLHNNFITYIDENRIMYLTDTMEGSSGSPVFNQKWELVGLHHKGGYLREPTSMGKVWRNAGININKVLKGIQENNIPGF